jgi:DNA-binding CsgD family transcriptional regulator
MYSSVANVMLGRFEDAETQVTRALEDAPQTREEVPLAETMLQINRAMAQAYAGRLSNAIALCETGRRAAIEDGAAEVAGMWAMILAEDQMLAGDIGGSLQTIREALEASREHDTFSVRGIQLGIAAVLASWLGNHEDASAFHREIIDDHLVRDARSRIQFDRATIWTAWFREGPAAAALLAQAAGDRAVSDTHLVWAAWSFYDAVRLGYPELVRDRLAGLARSVEGELIATMALHANALADGDGKELDQVSVAFERMGNMLCAAESAAHAHDAHLRAGVPVRARMAAARAGLISASLPGVMTPPLATTTAVPLTHRELEIAVLAADGRSSSEIGQRLRISVRTVDNHLGAVYSKLAVSGRGALSDVLGMRSMPEFLNETRVD